MSGERGSRDLFSGNDRLLLLSDKAYSPAKAENVRASQKQDTRHKIRDASDVLTAMLPEIMPSLRYRIPKFHAR